MNLANMHTATKPANADRSAPFAAALDQYQRAKAPRDAFELGVWNPAHEAGTMTPAIDDAMERLDEAFATAEHRLLKSPSPDAAAACFKFAIVHREGRDLAGEYQEILLAEAMRFSADLANGSALS